jgi:hypothetical protein
VEEEAAEGLAARQQRGQGGGHLAARCGRPLVDVNEGHQLVPRRTRLHEADHVE